MLTLTLTLTMTSSQWRSRWTKAITAVKALNWRLKFLSQRITANILCPFRAKTPRFVRCVIRHNNSHPHFQFTPMNLVHAYLSQFNGATLPGLQAPVVQPKGKSSKSIKTYPAGWFKALSDSKDVIRASILLTSPFPKPADARVMITECFHEVSTTLCNDGLILEPSTPA